MTYHYIPHGVCSRAIDIEVEDGVIQSVRFTGGCNGNTQGVSRLVIGMNAEEAVLQMNMLGHAFFVFLDSETNSTSIVYRRKDGNYGLIETD